MSDTTTNSQETPVPKEPIVLRSRSWLIENDFCPQDGCGGELDTGYECNRCGFDARPELNFKCAYDSDGDGDCHWCANRGGCVSIGGPFEIKPITPSIEHLQQLGILPKPVDDGFEFVK